MAQKPPHNNTSHHGSSPPLSVLNFGNAFVEISALTTFIGSSVTESLILGNEGGAGVAWVTMSAFGLMGAMKTCVGAASSGWLRNFLGARSENTDIAIGLEVSSAEQGRGAMKIRRSYGEKGPSGLSVDASVFLKSVIVFTGLCSSHVLRTVPRNREANREPQSSGKKFMHLIS